MEIYYYAKSLAIDFTDKEVEILNWAREFDPDCVKRIIDAFLEQRSAQRKEMLKEKLHYSYTTLGPDKKAEIHKLLDWKDK